jgi:GrpB-like predicted nucleotidyltransferase (UPF0157 family)
MTHQMKFFKPEDYLPKVIATFQNLQEQLSRIVPNAEIEHIGASAIKGAISKGDLDLLVRVEKNDFAESLARIQTIGFKIKDGTLRTESLCMLQSITTEIDAAIQLIEKGSKFEMFILFRDRLNNDPNLVEKYNQVKIDSTGLSADEYRSRKDKFIRSVIGDI